MPFTRFALPFFAPRRLDIAVLLLVLPLVHGMQKQADLDLLQLAGLHAEEAAREPWRLLTYFLVHPGWLPAVGNAIGLVVGLTMASRIAGAHIAWIGLVGSVLLPGLWLWFGLEGAEKMAGSSPAVYGALGMGTVAWLRLRHELTYQNRRDWLAGFGTIGLVVFALSMPLLLQSPVRGVHAVGVLWGALLLTVAPRHWARRKLPKAETDFPVPGGRRDPSSP